MGGLLFFDRVKETTTGTGTGALTLAGAATGFRTFASVLSDGDLTPYCIQGQTGSEWEVGLGTFAAAGPTLTRSTILASSNGGSAVVFSAGTKDVFLTAPAKGMQPAVLAKSATYILLPADCVGPLLVVVDATAGAVTITLPLALRRAMPITIKKVDVSANAVTVARAGSDVIDDATSFTIMSQYSPFTFVPDGSTKWWMT
jgi:hypothetical protein